MHTAKSDHACRMTRYGGHAALARWSAFVSYSSLPPPMPPLLLYASRASSMSPTLATPCYAPHLSEARPRPCARAQIRIELTQLKFNKSGMLRMQHLHHTAQEKAAAEAAEAESSGLGIPGLGVMGDVLGGIGAGLGGAMGGIGAMGGAMTGGMLPDMFGDSDNFLVIVKLQIPGDEELISGPIRVPRGVVPKIARFDL